MTVPGAPGTKPAACDFGLAQARGEYTLIFDSEDSPDPWMLLKAVRDFRAAPPQVACLQARLLFWNILAEKLRTRAEWMAAIVTRMYFVEYAVHFEFVLRGMARLGLVPPLGGTSNIFITDVLREIAIPTDTLVRGGIPRDVAGRMVAAWDPWCVAEDADIAGWLARAGYLVEMITDSWTLEEAPMSLAKAARQRARWGKGYAQAGAVQARHPLRAARQMGVRAFIAYTLMTIGTPLSLMLNPIFWGLTIAYVITRSVFIEHLFPPAVFYVGGADVPARQLHPVLPATGGLPAGPRAGTREVHAGPRALVGVHQLLDVEGHHRAVHPHAQVPLASHRARPGKPGHGQARNQEAARPHVGQKPDDHCRWQLVNPWGEHPWAQ